MRFIVRAIFMNLFQDYEHVMEFEVYSEGIEYVQAGFERENPALKVLDIY